MGPGAIPRPRHAPLSPTPDFVMAMNAASRIYPQIVSTMKESALAPDGLPSTPATQLA